MPLKAYHKPENMLYSDQSNEATMSEKSRTVPHGFGPLPHRRLDDASDPSCWACSVVCSGKSAASLVLVVRGSGDARPFSLMCSLMCSLLASRARSMGVSCSSILAVSTAALAPKVAPAPPA